MKTLNFGDYNLIFTIRLDKFPHLDTMHHELENKYAHRNLNMHETTIDGLIQSEGEIDGMLYYFRFRHNHAQLTVGINDLEYRRELYDNMEAQKTIRRQKLAHDISTGIIEENDMDAILIQMISQPAEFNADANAYPPERPLYWSSIDGLFDSNAKYASMMTPEQYREAFSWLVDNLEAVPTGE